MAISTATLTVDGRGFTVNATSADASGCEVVVPAQGSGVYIYLTHLVLACASTITATVGIGETTSAVTTAILGPVPFNITGTGPVDVWLNPPVQCTANSSLTLDTSGAGNICLLVQGYIE